MQGAAKRISTWLHLAASSQPMQAEASGPGSSPKGAAGTARQAQVLQGRAGAVHSHRLHRTPYVAGPVSGGKDEGVAAHLCSRERQAGGVSVRRPAGLHAPQCSRHGARLAGVDRRQAGGADGSDGSVGIVHGCGAVACAGWRGISRGITPASPEAPPRCPPCPRSELTCSLLHQLALLDAQHRARQQAQHGRRGVCCRRGRCKPAEAEGRMLVGRLYQLAISLQLLLVQAEHAPPSHSLTCQQASARQPPRGPRAGQAAGVRQAACQAQQR